MRAPRLGGRAHRKTNGRPPCFSMEPGTFVELPFDPQTATVASRLHGKQS